MRNYLVVGIAVCGACAQAVEPASVEPSQAVIGAALTTDADGDQVVTLDFGHARGLEFVESPDVAWVFERRPLQTASVLGTGTSAVSLYRKIRDANPSLPELFAGYSAAALEPSVDSRVGVTTNALTREEFLAGDGICDHHCDDDGFQEDGAFPYETTENCKTDLLGGNFNSSKTDTSNVGEKLFFSANARDVGGTFNVYVSLEEWLIINEVPVSHMTSNPRKKTKVLGDGEAASGVLTIHQTGDPNIYRRGVGYAEMVGEDEAVYDYYGCAAGSRR